MLKLVENGNNVALIVAGYSGDDTRKATEVLASGKMMSGMEAKVNTATESITTIQ